MSTRSRRESVEGLQMTVVVNVEQWKRDGSRGVEAGGRAGVRLACGHVVRCSRELALGMVSAVGVRCAKCGKRRR